MGKSGPAKIGAIYGRVSDDDSAEREHGSLEQQEHLGREQAKLLTETTGSLHEVKYVLIEERGLSGGTTKRPQYQRLLDLIRSRRIDFVVSKEVSRLNRSTQDFCELMALCKAHGVAVHIRGLSVDPNSPLSGALFQILAVIAELERNIIRERTRSSIRSAALNNQKIHGGPIPLGFDRNPAKVGYWLRNDRELEQVVYMMRHFNQCLSYKATLREAHLKDIKNKGGRPFTRSSLRRLLSNRKYIGKMRVPDDKKETWVDLPFGAAVPVELFEETQRNITIVEQQFTRKNRQYQRTYLLTGLLQMDDGSIFTGTYGTGRDGKVHYYYANKEHKINVRAPEIERAVLKALRVFEDDEKMIAYANEIRKGTYSQAEFVERHLQDVTRNLTKLGEEEAGLMSHLSRVTGGSETVLQWLERQLADIGERRSALTHAQRDLELQRDSLAAVSLEAKSLKKSLKVVFDRLDAGSPRISVGAIP